MLKCEYMKDGKWQKIINYLGKIIGLLLAIIALTIVLFLIVYFFYILIGDPCGLREKMAQGFGVFTHFN